MARILITVPPLTGHLNPALAVAAELSVRGHTVAWAVHAGKLAARLPPGACIYDIDDATAFDLAADSASVRGLESVRVFFEDFAMPLAASVMAPLKQAVADFQPDVMVVDHQMPGGALTARSVGLPWITLVTTSASILRMSPVFDAWVIEQYARLQQQCLAPALQVERPDFSPYCNVVFTVEALLGDAYPRVEAPYHFVGPSRGQGRRRVEFPWDWLDATRKKLLVTLGTVSRDRDTRFFEVIMAALSDMDVQAVLVAPAELQAQAPANVLVRDYIPQTELLTRMDGVLCHAGHNTVCETLACGLPMIVAPIRDDQPVIARQVLAAGAGLYMRQGKVSPAVAQALIRDLFNDKGLVRAAQSLQTALARAPGATGAAQVVEDVVCRVEAA